MDRIIGHCGICGGDVLVPSTWYGTRAPKPTCERCGAHAKTQIPVIEMEQVGRAQWGKQLQGAKAGR